MTMTTTPEYAYDARNDLTERTELLLTKRMKAALRTAAAEAGVSVSDWMRLELAQALAMRKKAQAQRPGPTT